MRLSLHCCFYIPYWIIGWLVGAFFFLILQMKGVLCEGEKNAGTDNTKLLKVEKIIQERRRSLNRFFLTGPQRTVWQHFLMCVKNVILCSFSNYEIQNGQCLNRIHEHRDTQLHISDAVILKKQQTRSINQMCKGGRREEVVLLLF